MARAKRAGKVRSKRPAAYEIKFTTDETNQDIEIYVVESTWNFDPPGCDDEGPGIEIRVFPNDGSDAAEFGFSFREGDAETFLVHFQEALRNLKERKA